MLPGGLTKITHAAAEAGSAKVVLEVAGPTTKMLLLPRLCRTRLGSLARRKHPPHLDDERCGSRGCVSRTKLLPDSPLKSARGEEIGYELGAVPAKLYNVGQRPALVPKCLLFELPHPLHQHGVVGVQVPLKHVPLRQVDDPQVVQLARAR